MAARRRHKKMEYILLVVGFVLLVKGADFFVEGSSSVAKLLRVPSVIIGLTIVAFGTSAPELAVRISASIAGSNDIAVGNVIGSNIFNLLMVVGICGLILPMKIDKSILYGDFLFTIVAAVVMLLLFAFDCTYPGKPCSRRSGRRRGDQGIKSILKHRVYYRRTGGYCDRW